jgi:hypothetical protein
MSKPPYASKVFVTFQTEACQQECLNTTSMGVIPRMMGKRNAAQKKCLFRGTGLLDIREAPEPSSIVWTNLGVDHTRDRARTAVSFFVFYVCLGLSVVFIMYIADPKNGINASVVGPCISFMNIVFPAVIQFSTAAMEVHENSETMQLSILNKMTAFRVTNTAFIIFATTPFEKLLSAPFLLKIQGILISNAIVTPILILLEPKVALLQKLMAPYAQTQEKMNSYYVSSSQRCHFRLQKARSAAPAPARS